MNLIFPEGFHYDCNACGRCCRTRWLISVNQHSWDKVKDTEFLKEAEAKRGSPPMVKIPGAQHAITHKADGSCTFLMPNNLCEMHAELGYEMKATGCQQFPFFPVITPDGVYVGLSHYCDAVQRDEGGELQRFTDKLNEWLSVQSYPTVKETTLLLTENIKLHWDAYKVFEAWLLQQMAEIPEPSAALWKGVLAICRLTLRFKAEGVKEVTRPMVEQAMAELPTGFLWGKAFMELTNLNVAIIAGVWEAGRQTDDRKVLREAILAGQDFRSTLLGKTLNSGMIQKYIQQSPNLGFRLPIYKRYLTHVIWRKWLPQEPLVASMSALFVAAWVMDFYFNMSAAANERETPEIKDVWKAMDIVELKFLLHNFGLASLYPHFAAGYMAQIDGVDRQLPVPEATTGWEDGAPDADVSSQGSG